ncbi:hypothetical protein [Levilactobacillus cerevisiae]|uniref:hypothetical protein n=1 Tax=Levilactobacillus cerevisiae TaxID=1704076 RepID=UPI00345E35FD
MKIKAWLAVGLCVVGLGLVSQSGVTAHAITDAVDIDNALRSVPQGLKLSGFFSPGTPNNNQATVVNGLNSASPNTQVVELTNGGSQVGSIWSNDDFLFNLRKKQVASMWLYFGNKSYGSATANAAGDGMALVLQNANNPKQATPSFGTGGAIGETLGVWGVATTGKTDMQAVSDTAIQNSWALEFDTYLNNDGSFDNTAKGSSFDLDTTDVTISNPHLAANYPGKPDTYTTHKVKGGTFNLLTNYYVTMVHRGLIQGSDFNFLSNGAWHHLTVTYTPKTSTASARMAYNFDDKDPSTGISQPGESNYMDIDTGNIDPNSTGLAYWGFTGATGGNSEGNLVAFEQIPNLVNASATADMTANGKPVTEGANVSANSPVALTYDTKYESGTTDWTAIQAELKIPTGVTISKGNVAYDDGTTTTLGAADIAAINAGKGIPLKTLNSGNATAKISLQGTANNVTSTTTADQSLSRFVGKEAVVQATLPNFNIVPSTLSLQTDQTAITADGSSAVPITGTITDSASTVANANLTVHATLNDGTLADTALATTDAAGKLTVSVPADKLNPGANVLDLTAENTQTGAVSNTGEVIITVGGLDFKTVTGKAVYKAKLSGQQQLVSRDGSSDLAIVIQDSRTKGSQWQLTAAATPLLDTNNTGMNGDLVYVDGNQSTTLSTVAAPVMSHQNDGTNGTTNVTGDWSTGQGLLLNVGSDAIQSTKIYSSDITWTLVDAEQ